MSLLKFWHWMELAISVFEKNQNIIKPKTLCDSCLGVYFLTRDGSRCSSCSAFTKDTFDGMRAHMVFCSTHVLAYSSFTFNHPFANRRIFIACVWIPPVFSSWNDKSLNFCFFSVFSSKETGFRNCFWNCLCCYLQLTCLLILGFNNKTSLLCEYFSWEKTTVSVATSGDRFEKRREKNKLWWFLSTRTLCGGFLLSTSWTFCQWLKLQRRGVGLFMDRYYRERLKDSILIVADFGRYPK